MIRNSSILFILFVAVNAFAATNQCPLVANVLIDAGYLNSDVGGVPSSPEANANNRSSLTGSPTSISVSAPSIDVTGKSSRVTVRDENNNEVLGALLSIDDLSVAYLDANGVLYPKREGEVIVTASIQMGQQFLTASAKVMVTNQVELLYLWGAGSENGVAAEAAYSVVRRGLSNGIISPVFELFANIGDGDILLTEAKSEQSTSWGTNEQGLLERGLSRIMTDVRGPAHMQFNLLTGEVLIQPMSFAVLSNMLKEGWNGSVPLPYQGNGKWGGEVLLRYATTEVPRFYFRGNNSDDLILKRVANTFNQLASPTNAEGAAVEDIQIPYGNYRIELDMKNAIFSIVCRRVDPMSLAYMGSSVCHNMGATNNNGYANQYTNLLTTRAQQGHLAFSTVNVSIGGNNSKNLLDRWERDLTPTCSKYVMYGISLGNEGIRESSTKDMVFAQWRDNMLQLINQAKERGMVPIIANNYTRSDFTSVEHNYVKQMNLLIHEWDLPSINLLGAIDDGTGKWANGYMADGAHPNDAGHAEFFYAMVPSLIEAIHSGIVQPEIRMNTQLTFNNNGDGVKRILWTPENILHPFAYSVDIKTSGSGDLFVFNNSIGQGIVSIDEVTGKLRYRAPNGVTIVSDKSINDGAWHRVTLSHFYAWGETHLYMDGVMSGRVVEKLVPTEFALNGENAPAVIAYRNLFAYRSALNELEVKALSEGRMLKSSLEVYAPLDESQLNETDKVMNRAQSLNKLSFDTPTSLNTVTKNNQKLLYDKLSSTVCISGVTADAGSVIELISNDGRVVKHEQYNNTPIAVADIPIGSYILILCNESRQEYSYFRFVKH